MSYATSLKNTTTDPSLFLPNEGWTPVTDVRQEMRGSTASQFCGDLPEPEGDATGAAGPEEDEILLEDAADVFVTVGVNDGARFRHVVPVLPRLTLHKYPVSMTHVAVQPSPDVLLPSSQGSFSVLMPLPHITVATELPCTETLLAGGFGAELD